MASKFPWETVKAESLRDICRDLTGNSRLGKRDEMIEFLRRVEEKGLDDALLALPPEAPKTGTKRKRLVDSDELPNGQPGRSARISDPGVGLVTRSQAASDKRGLRSSIQARPKRKSEFEGVVVTKRRSHHRGPKSGSSKTKEKSESPGVDSVIDADVAAEDGGNIDDTENVTEGSQEISDPPAADAGGSTSAQLSHTLEDQRKHALGSTIATDYAEGREANPDNGA